MWAHTKKPPIGGKCRHGQVAQAATAARSKRTMLFRVERYSPAMSKPNQPQEWSCRGTIPSPWQAPSFMCWGTTTVMGFEPTLPCVTGRCFEPLSYTVSYSIIGIRFQFRGINMLYGRSVRVLQRYMHACLQMLRIQCANPLRHKYV